MVANFVMLIKVLIGLIIYPLEVAISGLGLRYMSLVGATEQLNVGVHHLLESTTLMYKTYKGTLDKVNQNPPAKGQAFAGVLLNINTFGMGFGIWIAKWAIKKYLKPEEIQQAAWLA